MECNVINSVVQIDEDGMDMSLRKDHEDWIKNVKHLM